MARVSRTPQRFKGNCAACGEYDPLRRFYVTTRRPIDMQPHANMVTASGGGSGNSSWDNDDGDSKGVAWADQQTGGMPFGGSDRVGAAPTTQVGVGGDGYWDKGTGSGG